MLNMSTKGRHLCSFM